MDYLCVERLQGAVEHGIKMPLGLDLCRIHAGCTVPHRTINRYTYLTSHTSYTLFLRDKAHNVEQMTRNERTNKRTMLK